MKRRQMKKYIPWGYYCYDKNGRCPWWKHIKTIQLHRDMGCDYSNECKDECGTLPSNCCQIKIIKCEYMKYTDYEERSLLWDKCKECGEHDSIFL